MKDKVFLDTNIFVYSIDSSAELEVKRNICRRLVTDHIRNGSGIISIQVLQEFYQVSTSKIQVPISTDEALEFMHYMAGLSTVSPDLDMVVAAVRLHRKHAVSFWDALILQAAKTAGCSQLLSEDLQHGFSLGNLTVRNPFVE